MSTYKSIFGKQVKSLSSNLDNDQAEGQIWYNSTDDAFKNVIVSEAWASGSPMIFNRAYIAGFGTQTAALGCGGYNSPPATFETATEEYNGLGFSTGGALNTGRYGIRGAGSQTAGLAFFGIVPGSPNRSVATEEYNGTSWTNGGNLSEGRYQGAAAGTQTAGLAFGGGPATASPPVTTATEEYDGSSWTNGGALNTAIRDNGSASAAPQTAAISFGGNNASSITAQSEEYDGSSWTVVNSMNTGRAVLGGSGIQTDALAYGGTAPPDSAATEAYNGTTWTTSPATLATARRYLAGAGSNGSSAVAFQGKSGSTNTVLTEEYNKSVNVTIAGAWASGPAINTGRITKNGGLGPTSASLIFCGNPGTAPYTTNATEEYNGSSWSNGGNYPVSSSEVSGAAGTQTSALGFGQSDSPTTVVTNYDGSSWTVNPASFPASSGGCGTGEVNSAIYCGQTSTDSLEWNGSSWTSGGTMNTARTGQGSGFGNESSAIHATGRTSPSTLTNDSEEYNGSSWTSVGNVNTARKRLAASRAFSNASGYIFGGTPATSNAGPTFTDTEFWNGTNWATHPNLGTATGNQFGAGTTDAFSIGGQPNPPITTATEIFTPETTALNIKTITTS